MQPILGHNAWNANPKRSTDPLFDRTIFHRILRINERNHKIIKNSDIKNAAKKKRTRNICIEENDGTFFWENNDVKFSGKI